MLLFFGSELLLTARFPVALLTLLYVATVAAGYISLLTAGTWISRLLKNPPVSVTNERPIQAG